MIELINRPDFLLLCVPALIVAINQAAKKLGMSDRWCPVVNLLGGAIAFPLLRALGGDVVTSVIISLMVGLSSGGFYDFGAKTIKGK